MSRLVVIQDLDDDVFLLQFKTIAAEFFEESGHPGRLDFEFFLATWRRLMATGQAVMFVDELNGHFRGIIGALLVPNLFTGECMLAETFWFVSAKYRNSTAGMRLLMALREHAQKLGLRNLMMAHMHFAVSEEVATIYDRIGLKKLETVYVGTP